MSDEMPMPPYPDRDDPILSFIVRKSLAAIASGESDVEGAILYAAVHGWLEGHLQGETCPQACHTEERWQAPFYRRGDPELN